MPLRLKVYLGTVVLLALACVQPAGAQSGSVTGIIRSAETGSPLIAAVVQLMDAGGGRAGSSLTNQSGRYQISLVPPGTYTVVISSTGYATGRVENVTVAAGQPTTASLDLARQAINLDPVVISASRQQERALDAPARVEVVAEQEIEIRPAVTPADHLRSVPGIDIATSGVQSTTVAARGFNNIFSGSLYFLSDHRIAGVPSLRVNLLHFVPTTNEDLESIEVVLGPGSALYGPNTANGVLHMLTRSPLTSQGTSLSVTGGEQSLFQGSFRTAHLVGENLGIKLSGQYLQADEWEYRDPVELSEAAKFADAATGPFFRQDLMRAAGIDADEADVRIARIGNRDFEIQRWGGEARADWRINQDFTTVFSVGTNTSSGIELTGLGAGQAEDWRSTFYQARANYGRAFGQVYLNTSDAGDTFLLRNGAPISDKSKLFVTQLQHGAEIFGGRQDFTYGVDFLRTVPDTEGTINGIYEDDDETTEIGGYLQSETALSSMFDLVLAGRVDTHSALPDPIFSPRAALVFKPTANQTLRVSFNRAFSTPNSLNQFLDLGSAIPVVDAARLGYSLRIQGTGDRGFTFAQSDGAYLMRSPFNPDPAALVPAAAARAYWPAAVQVVAAGSAAQGLTLPPQLIAFLSSLTPASVDLEYGHALTPTDRGPLSELTALDIERIRESTSNTIEAGYKGILGQRVLLSADVWWTRKQDLVTPLTIATPFVHFDRETTEAFLLPQLTGFFTAAGIAAGLPPAAAAAQAAAQAAQFAPQLAGGFARVPVGVISSADVNANGAQLLMTYYNVDENVDVYGTDISASAILMDDLSLDLSLSLVSDDVFTTSEGSRVTLNAPKRKGSAALIYRNDTGGLFGELRARHNAAYPVDSGVYKATACIGDEVSGVEDCVGDYTLLDLTAGYQVPGVNGASLQLTIQNLLNEEYRSYPGVPKIGRMALLRLRYEL